MSKNWNPAKNEIRSRLGDQFEQLRLESKVLSTRLELPDTSPIDPLVVPIYHSSTYRFKTTDEYLDVIEKGGYVYQRLGNPTQDTAEVIINEMEHGAGTLVFNSGLAAMNAILLTFLKQGDHIVCQWPCYSGTYKFIENVMIKFGIEVSWVAAGCPISEFKSAIRSNTTLLIGETPCNPTMNVLDVEQFAQLGSEKILLAVDSTFGTPYCQQPVKYGVDFVFHSCTKYMGGHSDLIGGCVTVRNVDHWKKFKVFQSYTGSTLSASDCSLLIRGLKTLPLRMEKHCYNAMQIAQFLEVHPKVKRVWYPGLASHPQHQTAKQFMSSFGGMISFEMENGKMAKRVVENVNLIHLAVSLGGVETLIEHPASMTHGPMIMDKNDKHKVLDGLIRLSIGLENVEDLKSDLNDAIDKA